MSLLFVIFACTGATPTPAAAPTPQAAPSAQAAPAAPAPDDQIRALLAPLDHLNRPAFVGAVGDQQDCVIAVVAGGGERMEIELIVRCGETIARSGALQQWIGYEEGAFWLQDINGDGKNEVIVMATWITGIGPTGGQPFQANSVMSLDGTTLHHDEAAEAKVGALETEDAVRKALTKG